MRQVIDQESDELQLLKEISMYLKEDYILVTDSVKDHISLTYSPRELRTTLA